MTKHHLDSPRVVSSERGCEQCRWPGLYSELLFFEGLKGKTLCTLMLKPQGKKTVCPWSWAIAWLCMSVYVKWHSWVLRVTNVKAQAESSFQVLYDPSSTLWGQWYRLADLSHHPHTSLVQKSPHEMKWKLLSHVWLFVTPRIIQSMEFFRPEYWSG